MSLSDAFSYRGPVQWPQDVVDEIVGVRMVVDDMLFAATTEVRLRGGESIRMVGKADPESIVKVVREVMRKREDALLATGEITDPVGARVALGMMYAAAGWVEAQRTGCPCCKVFALAGCILPPGADEDAERCTYTDDCKCWGGLRRADEGAEDNDERWCEDCRAGWYDERG